MTDMVKGFFLLFCSEDWRGRGRESFFFLLKFIYFESGERGREREKESQAGSVLSAQSVMWGSVPRIMRS